jgi:hypothetical protein
MAQGRFREAKRAAGSGKPTAVDDLHKIKEVVQLEHADLQIVQPFGRYVRACRLFGRSSSDYLSTCRPNVINSLQEHVVLDQQRPYEQLTSENAALILIDHKVGLMTGVRDYSTGELKHNVVGLAKAAKALKLPIIVTTTARL